MQLEDLHDAIDRIAGELALRHGAKTSWKSNVLAITHPALQGRIAIDADTVVEARLGLLMALYRDELKRELIELLDQNVG